MALEHYNEYNSHINGSSSACIPSLTETNKLSTLHDLLQLVLEQKAQQTELLLRVTTLESNRGLDRIMIEEVREISEAIVEQHEEQLRAEITDFIQDSLVSLQEDKQHSFNQSTEQENQTEHIEKTVVDIQLCINELKQNINSLSKDLIHKLSTEEAEKIVNRLQKDVLNELSQTQEEFRCLETKIKKDLEKTIHNLEKNESKRKKGFKNICDEEEKMKEIIFSLDSKINEISNEVYRTKITIETTTQEKEKMRHMQNEHFKQLAELYSVVESLLLEREKEKEQILQRALNIKTDKENSRVKLDSCFQTKKVSLMNTPLLLEYTPAESSVSRREI